MLDRLIAALESMFKAFTGHAESPEKELEQTYQELQETLVRVRQDLANAIAKQEQLRQEESPELALQELIVSKLKERVEELENGLLSAHTEKQMMMSRNKDIGSAMPEQKALMILFVGILSLWLIISLGLLIAHLLH